MFESRVEMEFLTPSGDRFVLKNVPASVRFVKIIPGEKGGVGGLDLDPEGMNSKKPSEEGTS